MPMIATQIVRMASGLHEGQPTGCVRLVEAPQVPTCRTGHGNQRHGTSLPDVRITGVRRVEDTRRMYGL